MIFIDIAKFLLHLPKYIIFKILLEKKMQEFFEIYQKSIKQKYQTA